MSDLMISDYSSLSFDDFKPKKFETSDVYVQRFMTTDSINIQMTGLKVNNYQLKLYDITNNLISTTPFVSTNIDFVNAYFSASLTVANPNIYYVTINSGSDVIAKSNLFAIQSEVEDSVLIQYTHSCNDYDTIFKDNNVSKVFNFRVDGGFLSDNEQVFAEVEFARNQRQEMKTTYSMPFTKHVLTIGDNNGVPSWVARKINQIFSLDTITVDGVSYVRSEGEVPSQVKIMEGYPYFNYTFTIETQENVFYVKKK